RVNSDYPRTRLNKQRVLIDANFSTLHFTPHSKISEYALLAVLSSSWIRAAMELTGSVMGGGALKLEATHLRKLPIPTFGGAEWETLHKIGADLARGSAQQTALSAIDAVFTTFFVGEIGGVEHREALQRLMAFHFSL